MKSESLIEKLIKNDKIPFHMPGHKRNCSLAIGKKYFKDLPFNLDITEIENFDDLHNPKDIIKDIMDRASSLWKSEKSFIMINGSTGGILSAIYASVGLNNSILISRNCHKSVYHACEIFNLDVSYIYPEFDKEYGLYTNISVEKLELVLSENRNIKAFVLTSPTYEGFNSDVYEISKICHKWGVVLIVDQAHGAHFGLSDYFSKSAVELGADIVVQSLHKTLFSLTSTAILHVNSKLVDYKKIQRALGIFQTSSPSYILLSSIDSCIRLIEEEKILFKNWNDNLLKIDNLSKSIKNLKILFRNLDKKVYDKSKIVISCNGYMSTVELSSLLREKYNIEVEMVSNNYIIAMTGIGDKSENIDYFVSVIKEIDENLIIRNYNKFKSETVYNLKNDFFSSKKIFDAITSESIEVKKENAIGKISSEYIWAYPPGIPLIVPGEVVTKALLDIIECYFKNGIELHFSKSNNKDKITICNN